MSIWQRINGSWSDHDAVRHYMYEGLCRTLSEQVFDERPHRVLEIGSREPTTSLIRMLKYLLGERCVAEVANWPQVDIQRMPYLNGSVDIFIADQVLEHVERPWLAAEEIWRVTAQGGLAIVATPFLHPIHPAPLDCWRLGFDAYRLLFPQHLWHTLTLDSWGNRAICRELYTNGLSAGMTNQWIPYTTARQHLPSFDTPADGLHPVVMWFVGRKR